MERGEGPAKAAHSSPRLTLLPVWAKERGPAHHQPMSATPASRSSGREPRSGPLLLTAPDVRPASVWPIGLPSGFSVRARARHGSGTRHGGRVGPAEDLSGH